MDGGRIIAGLATGGSDVVSAALADGGLGRDPGVPVIQGIPVADALAHPDQAIVLTDNDAAMLLTRTGPGYARLLAHAPASVDYAAAQGGVAGLADAARAVFGRYIPESGGRPWFVPPGKPRVAAVPEHLFLAEVEHARPRRAYERLGEWRIVQVKADSVAELQAHLDGMAGGAEAQVEGRGALTMALMGRNDAELQQEIASAQRGLAGAMENGDEWQTPRGSYFTARPLGRSGSVAFVYPGAFSAYPGMGREVFRLFPGSWDALGRLTSDPGAVFAEELVFPRTPGRLADQEARLMADPAAMIEAGTSCAAVYTHVLREVLGLEPAATFGYSLGESSMLWALGVWTEGDESHARFAKSDLFRTRLGGAQEAVRQYRAAAGYFDPEPDPWGTFSILASPADVEEALRSFDLAFLTIVNGPQEVLVSGDPAQCRAVASQVGSEAVRLAFNAALHCPIAMVEVGEFVRLNLHQTHPLDGVRLYSACYDEPLRIESQALAEATARMSCKLLDFRRLVERVYEDGARIFVEAGPQSACTRLVHNILGDRPHLAVPVDRRGVDVENSIFRLVARLLSHDVPFDPSALLGAG
ncbi:MAG: hypothetical protein JO247_01520 [Chloroflexi bacterium]|nr:hypothetical protein [Chloroflexota bacterium]